MIFIIKKSNLERNELIYNLYFNNKLTITEISKKINLSISQVSRILSNSPKYMQEKLKRKEENKKRHLEQTKEFIKNKRAIKNAEETAIMKGLHNQAVAELSYTPYISNIAIRKNCSSAYTYNINRKRFEIKNDMVYSIDMPKIIKY